MCLLEIEQISNIIVRANYVKTFWKIKRWIQCNESFDNSPVISTNIYHCLNNVFHDLHHHHHHHHVVPPARISLTLSHHFSLSFIASGRSSGLHSVSSQSCCMYVRASRPAFARPYVGVHRSTLLMSSSLLLQQCPACLVRLTWIVFVMSHPIGGRIVGALWGVASWTCSILFAAFLFNCRLVFSPAVLLASMLCIHIAVSIRPQLGRNCVSFYWLGLTSIWSIAYFFLYILHPWLYNYGVRMKSLLETLSYNISLY